MADDARPQVGDLGLEPSDMLRTAPLPNAIKTVRVKATEALAPVGETDAFFYVESGGRDGWLPKTSVSTQS